jgi:hypothetical protein
MYLVSMDVDPENLMDTLTSPTSPSAQGGMVYGSPLPAGPETVSHIGPLNEGLNAICIPAAYSTSRLMRRVVSGLYGHSPMPNGNPFAMPIRQVTWSDAAGLFRRFHYANNLNGHREYRVEHRPLWSDALSWRSLAATEGGAVPQIDRGSYETIFALTKDQSVAPQTLWNAARSCGLLQQPTTSYVSHVPTAELEELHRRRAQVASEIEYFDRLPIHDRIYTTREDLRAEQRRLLQDIDILQRDLPSETELRDQRLYATQREQWQRELSEGLIRVEQLSGQVTRLRQEQQRLVDELHLAAKPNKPAVITETLVPVVTKNHMERLTDIDTQLHHWQRTAAEIAAHRQQLEQSAVQLRVEKQNDLSNPYVPADPRDPLRALENQLLQTRRQLEELVQAYNHGTRGNNYVDVSLPTTLKAMQENLYEVCRQISRKESDTASRQLHDQIDQLSRCERELTTAIEKLLQDRLGLLQQIAVEIGVPVDQLKLKLPFQCGCDQHATKLHNYRSEQRPLEVKSVVRKAIDDGAETLIREKIRETEAKLRAAQGDHAALLLEIRRLEDRLKDVPKVRVIDHARIAQLKDQLERVEQRLRHWDRIDDLRAEVRDLDRRIADCRAVEYRAPVVVESPLYQAANSWFEKLTAVPEQAIQGRALPLWARDQEWGYHYNRQPATAYGEWNPVFDATSGRSMEEYRLAILAIRLAIVDALMARGHSAPLLIDDVWNELSVPAARQAMGVLAEMARRGVQVVVLTADPRVTALARSHQAWVCHVRPVVDRIPEPVTVVEPTVAPQVAKFVDPVEVNKRLHAFADEIYATTEPTVLPLKIAETPAVESTPKKSRVKTYYVDGRGPFYLSRSSRIEEAPSMDDAMASRLRKVGIQTIGNLLDASPDKISLKLEDTSDGDYYRAQGFSNSGRMKPNRYVSPKRVARWQAEAKLVCEVPNVRAFDSKIMVGCGIKTPRRLSQLTPNQLAKRVGNFLQTERGRQVLRSGNGYEVARITSWIVEANQNKKPRQDRDHDGAARRSSRSEQSARADRPAERDMSRAEKRLQREMRRRLREERPALAERPDRTIRAERSDRTSRAERPDRTSRAERPDRGERTARPERSVQAAKANPVEQPAVVQRKREVRRVVSSQPAVGAETITRQSTKVLKFFLSQDRPVVDAPSVGPKVAQRMNNLGIFTVRDFLQADPESLSSRLAESRVSGDVLRQWQQQSQLVCRVPDLRGHDAQLLVAAGVHSPERLAKSVPGRLHEEIRRIAESNQGKRILRGASVPDLAEVQSWVEAAALCRPLAAA